VSVVELSGTSLIKRRAANSPAKETTSWRGRWRQLALAAILLTLVIEVVLAAPYLGGAMSAVDRPDLRWVALAIITELISLGAFARLQRRMLSAGGARVPMCQMAALTYAANAVSVTLPGGTAWSSGYVFNRLRSWGATVPAAGFTILASGLLSTLSFAALVVTCAAIAGNGGLGSVIVVAGAAAAAFATRIARRRVAPDAVVRIATRGLDRVNRIVRRPPQLGLAGLHRFVGELTAIKPRRTDWWAGFGFAELNWLADLACLLACCQAVGATGPSLLIVTFAYLAGKSTSGLSVLPGGIGVMDAAMILGLTQSGGVSPVTATAAVLLYRLISFAFIAALGWMVWGGTWLAQRRRLSADGVKG